jgi:hypothetical protein
LRSISLLRPQSYPYHAKPPTTKSETAKDFTL